MEASAKKWGNEAIEKRCIVTAGIAAQSVLIRRVTPVYSGGKRYPCTHDKQTVSWDAVAQNPNVSVGAYTMALPTTRLT